MISNITSSVRIMEYTRIGLSFLCCLALFLTCFYNNNPWLGYTLGICSLYLLNIPPYISSPRNILFAYYFCWFTFPVKLGLRYEGIDLASSISSEAFLYLFLTFALSFSFMSIIETPNTLPTKEKNFPYRQSTFLIEWKDILSFLMVCFTLMWFIQKSGGASFWLENGGRAFLLRKGSGLQYLFFTLSLFYFSFQLGSKKMYLYQRIPLSLLYILFILILSPFIGSKLKIIMALLLFFLPSFYFKRSVSSKTVLIGLGGFLILVVGNYYRNMSWMSFNDVLPYTLNYFDTFESLHQIFSLFYHQSLFSLHYPFYKFSQYFTESPYAFFDLSTYLSSLFHPDSWSINATVQYSIEAQMYLALPFGLGFIISTFPGVIASLIYRFSLSTTYYSLYFISFLITLQVVTHYRGGVLYWTDFYMVPFYLVCFGLEVLYKRKDRVLTIKKNHHQQ